MNIQPKDGGKKSWIEDWFVGFVFRQENDTKGKYAMISFQARQNPKRRNW